jgi:hypothetical protein
VSSDAAADSVDCAQRWSILRPAPDVCLPPIETDRPHLTETPHTVPGGHVQLESGLALFDLDGGGLRGVRFLEQIYKVGLVSGIDLQLLTIHSQLADGALTAHAAPLTVRVKVALLDQEGAIPTLTVVPVVSVPLRDEQRWAAGALAYAAWQLGPRTELEVNTGLTFERADPSWTPVVLAAAAVTQDLVGELGGFAELFGLVSPSARHVDLILGTGLVYRVHRDVQLDTGMWIGLAGQVAPVTPFAGISLRR